MSSEITMDVLGVKSGSFDKEITAAIFDSCAWFGAKCEAATGVMNQLLGEFRDRVYTEVKESDRYFLKGDGHDLKSLEALDHPYARRHGQILDIGHSTTAVHVQTEKNEENAGSVFDSIQKPSQLGDQDLEYVITIDSDNFYYWKYVVEGTGFMLPRDLPFQIYADHRNIFKTEFESRYPSIFVQASQTLYEGQK